MDLYQKLYELGHPSYLKEWDIEPIQCSTRTEAVEELTSNIQKLLEHWSHKVTQLRDASTWLLFFSMPKMLLLHQIMSSSNENKIKAVEKIVHEISFLAINQSFSMEFLREKVEVT